MTNTSLVVRGDKTGVTIEERCQEGTVVQDFKFDTPTQAEAFAIEIKRAAKVASEAMEADRIKKETGVTNYA